MGDFGAARANLFRKPKLSHLTRRAGDTLGLQAGDCGRGDLDEQAGHFCIQRCVGAMGAALSCRRGSFANFARTRALRGSAYHIDKFEK